MIKRNILYYGITVLLFSLTGCATILSGTSQKVLIDSTPQGATIIIDGENEGITPSKVKIEKELNDLIEGGRDIELVLDGYEKDGYQLKAALNPIAILNFVNIACWAIDAATGAIIQYDNTYNFQLRPVEDREINESSTPTPKPAPTPTPNSTSKYEKLKELKELLDEGIITQEEFDKEKAKILNE